MRLADGRVLIADTANARWVVVDPSSAAATNQPSSIGTTEVPWPSGISVRSQPAVDDAGIVYAVMSGPLGDGGTQGAELWVLDPSNLATPMSTHPAPSVGGVRIELTPTQVIVGGTVIDGLTPTIGTRPDIEYIAADPATGIGTRIRLVWHGVTTTFEYPSNESPEFFGPMPGLADGSVIVLVTEQSREFVDRLTVDGQVHRLEIPPAGSVFGAGWVEQDGFLQLEMSGNPAQWNLVKYDLP